jgi:hypothetical protein
MPKPEWQISRSPQVFASTAERDVAWPTSGINGPKPLAGWWCYIGTQLMQYDGTSWVDVATEAYVDTAKAAVAWGEVGYAQITADSATFTTTTDITGLSVAVTVVTGRKYEVTGHAVMSSSVSTDNTGIVCRIGSTTYGRFGHAVVNNGFVAHGSVRFTGLAAGATTFKVTGERFTGSGNCQVLAGAAYPAFIMVEDIGPA